jgi:uncharacterized protein
MAQSEMNTDASDDAPFVLKPLPILIAILLGFGVAVLSSFTITFAEHFFRLPERPDMRWIDYSYVEITQLFYALLAINWIKRYYPGDYGLRWPQGNSYVASAILWGFLFGVVRTLADFLPQIIAHMPPSQPYGLGSFNIAGWLSYQGVVEGSSEEILLRGLLVTYLTTTMPGRVSFRGYGMNGAGLIVAALFALTHLYDFFFHPLAIALGQVVCTFVFGVFFAYWYEKSRSLLAPIVGHSLSNVTEQVLIFAMVAAWAH